MKPTTKITIAIILSIFVLSLTFITGFSFTDRKNYHRTYGTIVNISQDHQTGIETGAYRTVVLEREKEVEVKRIYHVFAVENCGLHLNPVSAESEKNTLFIPDELLDFISATTCNDTLTIKIKVDELSGKYGANERTTVSFTGINFYLHTARVDVINRLFEIPTFIRDIETDTVRVNSKGNVRIESCTVQVVEPLKVRSFKISDCKIRTLNTDLNFAGNWKVERCQIETENLTGSGSHNITLLADDDTKRINWLPKNKDSKLNITLQGDTTGLVFQ
jgi:hypothetical protein